MGISSVGLSSGTLNQDLLDKLKAADTASFVNPISSRITKATQKKTDLSTLMTGLSSLKISASDLSSDSAYLKRTASSSDSTIADITASTGVTPQTLNMKVNQIAKNDVFQLGAFSSSTATVTSSQSTLYVRVGDDDEVAVSIAGGTSLEDFVQKINDAMDGDAVASIVNDGSSTNPYKLMIKSATTGKENAVSVRSSGTLTGLTETTYKAGSTVSAGTGTISTIKFQVDDDDDGTFGESGENSLTLSNIKLTGTTASENAKTIVNAINEKMKDSGITARYNTTDNKIEIMNGNGHAVQMNVTDSTGFSGLSSLDGTTLAKTTKLQYAQDSKFHMDGIDYVRSSNSITDVISGVTLKLKKVDTDDVSLTISRDTSSISQTASEFVANYNAIVSKIGDLTKYDSTTKTAGSLQGQSEITSILPSLSQTLFKQVDEKTLSNYGFSLNKSGMLEFDSSVLSEKLSDDADAVQKFFKGTTTGDTVSYTALKKATTDKKIVPYGDIVINGVSIASVTTKQADASATATELAQIQEDNAQLFIEAINKQTDDTGVSASYDKTVGKIKLTRKGGGEIKVKTTTLAAEASGLSGSESSNVALTGALNAYGKKTTTEGVFAKINTYMKGLITGDSSVLQSMSSNYQKQIEKDTTAKEAATTRLTTKYEQMASQFASYDAIIAKYQQQATTITNMINAASSSS